MKIAATLGALALVAQLAGCPSTPSINPQDVINAAQLICSFVPTAETVAAVLGASGSTLTTATQVATAICSAVPPASTTTTSAAKASGDVQVGTVKVNGKDVPVVGHYSVHH